MTDAQKHLLMLFKEINKICLENNIIYYLAGGTLLGAIRHKGFIPWDDDMDILMTRKNWNKFIDICKEQLPENRILECQELNRDYPNMIGRYTDKESCAIHENQILGKGTAGYVVDILVLDPIDDDQNSYISYREDLMLYSDLINPTLNYSYRWGINKKRYNEYYKKIKKYGKDKVLSELEKKLFKYDEDECNKYVMRWGGAPFIFDKEMYGHSRWTRFEGELCRIPDKTIEYLIWHYGDKWMYIPPHDKQESHNAIFSRSVNYEELQKDYLPYINNIDRYEENLIKRKKFFFSNMKLKMKEKSLLAESMAIAAKLEIEKNFEDNKNVIEKLHNNEEYDKLYLFFEDYYSVQWDKKLIGREDFLGVYRFNNPILVDINENIFCLAIKTLFNMNEITKAYRLISVWEKEKGYLSKSLENVKNSINEIRRAAVLYYDNDKKGAMVCISYLYKKYPKNISVKMFYIRLLLEQGDIDIAMKESRQAVQEFSHIGDFYKYLGDCYYYENLERAVELYKYAYKRTKNGCVLLEIKEKIAANKEKILSKLTDKKNIIWVLELTSNQYDF